MIIQHNMAAIHSNRMYGMTYQHTMALAEKLSSGYRINRSADDAAGLSISEKMRSQIRGLTQAAYNAQDGISMVQTAEGALHEVQEMLQRMNQLAIQAANETNSEDDRRYLQNEVNQILGEIDRISETILFNETRLLDGEHGRVSGEKIKANTEVKVTGLNLTYEVRDGIANHTGKCMPSTLEGKILNNAGENTDSVQGEVVIALPQQRENLLFQNKNA